MKKLALALLAFGLLTVAAYSEPAPRHFCTMEQGVDRLLEAADIPEDFQREPIVRYMASSIVSDKLVEKPGQPIEITWKDIYDLRGTINAWLCNQGRKMNCVGQAIDAVGAGLTGTTVGKVMMGGGLALSGPPGFVMLAGMSITQETFQCQPSAVIMAIEAGASVAVSLPWCKVPGLNQACVSVTNGVKEGALVAARKIFGDKVVVKALKETKDGLEVVLVKAEKASQNAAAAGLEKPASSQISSKISPGDKKPEINSGSGSVGHASPATKAHLAEIYEKASAAKAEIDNLAGNIAHKVGGRVATAPLKSQERALDKVFKDYKGDVTHLKDLARNTIVVEESQYAQAVSLLREQGAKVKTISSASDPLGYSGTNTLIRTKAGIPAEIQVNTPEMIYAKELPVNARKILGEQKYAELRVKTGVEGGRGHELYEKYRSLPEGDPQAAKIAAESRAYYDLIRRAMRGR